MNAWIANQAAVARSSGEAKCYSMVKAGGVAPGMEAFLTDLGIQDAGKMPFNTDASAAIGVSTRVGIGRKGQTHRGQSALAARAGGSR